MYNPIITGENSKIDFKKYTLNKNLMSASYDLKNYNQKYTGNSFAENLYTSLIKSMPQGSHIGNYES
ncbi:hypothetical protein KAI04_00900 [Candidatus Pacearchaeota archaeon]|nr:hypothetical protein [Candidatus Pacearchaeota archaeon]